MTILYISLWHRIWAIVFLSLFSSVGQLNLFGHTTLKSANKRFLLLLDRDLKFRW